MEKISIEEAMSKNLLKYFTGKPCKYGHISERYLSNKECVSCRSEKTKGYAKTGYFKEYRENNKQKEQEYRKQYKKENKDIINAGTAKYRASKRNRTPLWLTEEDYFLINEAYRLATLRTKTTGFSWHVDHVVPLQGETVSGLHVPENLSVIPWIDNVTKRNVWSWDNQK